MKRAIATLLLFSSLLLLQSCGNRISLKKGEPSEQSMQRSIDSGNVKIAFVAPLSGKDAKVGRSLLDAAQMALHDNKIGGITLYPVDSQSRNSVNTIRDKDIHIVVGPLFADDTMMIYNMVSSSGVPVFSFSNDASLGGKDGLYLLGISVADQINSVVSFARSNGYRKIFTVTPQNRYGDMVKSTAKNVGGVEVVEAYEYNERDNVVGFSSIATNIHSQAGGEGGAKHAVLFPASDSKLIAFAKALELSAENEEIEMPILGSIQWDEPRIYRSYSNLLRGSYFPSVEHRSIEQFQQKFSRNFGYSPSVIAALGYDAISIISQTIESIRANNANYISDGAIQGQTFSNTITGITSVNADGTMHRKLTVRRID